MVAPSKIKSKINSSGRGRPPYTSWDVYLSRLYVLLWAWESGVCSENCAAWAGRSLLGLKANSRFLGGAVAGAPAGSE